MKPKKIFTKEKYNKKKTYTILLILIITSFFFYLNLYKENTSYIVVSSDINNFYVIPKDRGGEKVQNLNKKSLNLNSEQGFDKSLYRPKDIYFSIQFYADNTFEGVSKYLKKINNGDESIYNLNEFIILALNSEIGTDYFLLYKNFATKELAKKYCVNFLSKLNKCIIVDTTKF